MPARRGIWQARAFYKLACCSLLALVAGCATPPAEQKNAAPSLEKTSFADLPGWPDSSAGALTTLRKSCPQLVKNGTMRPAVTQGSDWQDFCSKLGSTNLATLAETDLQPYRIVAGDNYGLFTGYYEPLLHASRTRDAAHAAPIYARPADLIDVDLGAFKDSLKGQKISGKVKGTRLVPYDDRALIDRGTLDKRAGVLMWADNAVDPFFLEVQGSGRAQLTDGSVVALAYDGQNGQTYTSVGKVLKETGEIAPPVTMEKIRVWLAAHPGRAQAELEANKSYVFFKETKIADGAADGPKGAAGLPLTPEHSLAVDPVYYSYNLPLYLATTTPDGAALDRLAVAQDTGGAITGPIRADVFWGFGDRAAAMAGSMQQPGALYVLLPKPVQVR